MAAPPERTSASAFAAMIVSARTAPVGTIIQGCWKMKRAAVWIMPPHVGSGGCGPRPMKARPACIMMPTPKKSTNCTMTVVDMFGSTWRKLATWSAHAVDGGGFDEQLLLQVLRLTEQDAVQRTEQQHTEQRP